jgi:hypothetical protein
MSQPVRVLLLRREGCSTIDLKPGEYLPGRQGNWVTIRCPQCKLLATITRQSFGVSWDGTVSPCAICPHLGCTFKQWIALDGWIPAGQGTA